ncbi:hypothetical protein KAT92_06510 [Candidatus Babeliales bacterium]|nr:hypothetical protein [Candidatus Babeliales bacterium]
MISDKLGLETAISELINGYEISSGFEVVSVKLLDINHKLIEKEHMKKPDEYVLSRVTVDVTK